METTEIFITGCIETVESYTYPTLWMLKQDNKLFIRSSSFVSVLLILSGDIELNPGPRSMPELTKLLRCKGIKIFHQNVRGLFPNIINIRALIHDFRIMDIITLSETHINTKSCNNNVELYSIPGYAFIHRNRKIGTHGGVGIYISDRLKWKGEKIWKTKIRCNFNYKPYKYYSTRCFSIVYWRS